MLRIALLAAGALALAGSASSTHTFEQRGTIEGPRAARYDGQPLPTQARLEAHGGTMIAPAMDQDGASTQAPASIAAVTRKQVGASARFRANARTDLGFEVDGSWDPTVHDVDGHVVDAPHETAVTVVATLRTAVRVDEHATIGFALDVGGSSTPIYRANEQVTFNDDYTFLQPGETQPPIGRDIAPVARLNVVPSYKVGALTVFGSLGASTVTGVPPIIRWVDDGGSDDDPGVQTSVDGVALTAAAGISFEANQRTHMTARISDAASPQVAAGHYGPQVDVGLSFDLGK